MSVKQIAVVLVLIAGATITLILPLMNYVFVGWRARRNEIMDGLSADARYEYFRKFVQGEKQPTREAASQQFEAMYGHWYGRRFFIVPGILLILIGAAAVTAVVLTALEFLKFSNSPLFVLPVPAASAISGAYLWVANDHISRARRLDFAPSDVLWGVLRIVVSVPMGYAFASIVPAKFGPFVAFALGAFPLASLTSLLQRLATKMLGAETTPDEASDDIIKLQGVNKVIMERLANEDVTTVSQVAYCDPVRLTMRSNLPFNFIIDLMNQALAWMYLEELLDVIRPRGIRGACEIKWLIGDFDNATAADSGESNAHNIAVLALPLLATACRQAPETLQFTFRQIAEDPFTTFLETIWNMTDLGAASEPELAAKSKENRSPSPTTGSLP